ncbi:MAG: glycoside hydrolase family 99-like domain-containing protein [Bacteroidales bacterium]
MSSSIKFLAYYLPQYFPIPENNAWWGKGFTEWTNVTKAKPLFKGHYQPRLPADLGFYDLRLPEIREEQAALAKAYGVGGFAYYHYWFGNGKKLLERPLKEVVSSCKPDFPFCICWANESWKGIWFGDYQNKILIEQQYPGKQDYIDHFNYLLSAFSDERYIRINGKILFNVYMPLSIPDLNLFVDTFRECALNAGIGELYLLASRVPENWNPLENGFDGVIGSEFTTLRYASSILHENLTIFKSMRQQIFGKKELNIEKRQKPLILEYSEACKYLLPNKKYTFDYFPCAINDWDNSARAGNKSIILKNSTPEYWKKHLSEACNYTVTNNPDNPLVFIKSWNEWAEGNYLEPDQRWGHQYLKVIQDIKKRFQ